LFLKVEDLDSYQMAEGLADKA